MKTAKITDLLKKELLIIELPRLSDYHASERKLWVKDTQSGEELTIKGSWDVLGKPDEISEDDAKELVESNFIEFWYPNEFDGYGFDKFKNYKTAEFSEVDATESLLSAIESEIYWENPVPKLSDFEYFLPSMNEVLKLQKKYDEAESRTFDRNRSIILVKN